MTNCIGGDNIQEQLVKIHLEPPINEFSEHRIHFINPVTSDSLKDFPYGSCGHPVHNPDILRVLQGVEGKVVHFLSLRYEICSDTTGGNIINAPKSYDYVGPMIGICFQELDDSGKPGEIISTGILE